MANSPAKKTLCKYTRQDIAASNMAELIAEPQFFCGACARSSSQKNALCQPVALTELTDQVFDLTSAHTSELTSQDPIQVNPQQDHLPQVNRSAQAVEKAKALKAQREASIKETPLKHGVHLVEPIYPSPSPSPSQTKTPDLDLIKQVLKLQHKQEKAEKKQQKMRKKLLEKQSELADKHHKVLKQERKLLKQQAKLNKQQAQMKQKLAQYELDWPLSALSAVSGLNTENKERVSQLKVLH
ncbi:hypothetical protein [Vibrio algicola]|uniref:Uncharacterized protein n=1 Tax=Vibrio algicola TaxID=2662262 RepID=A0A5Q0TGQ6_9VIBR|nr:hypothetical protein [Vibrio algicola]